MSWKALRHPNVLPLLGVIMTETEFSMVSEWMSNGNINQFVATHKDANRFELVCSPLKLLYSSPITDDFVAPIAGRCHKGLDIYAQSGYDSWRSQGGTSTKVAATAFS